MQKGGARMTCDQAEERSAVYHFGRLLARCYEVGLLSGETPDDALRSAIGAPRDAANRACASLLAQGKRDWYSDLDAHLGDLPTAFDAQATSFCARGFDQELVHLIRLRWYGFGSPQVYGAGSVDDRKAMDNITGIKEK
jgi:hypothetical protein